MARIGKGMGLDLRGERRGVGEGGNREHAQGLFGAA